MSDDEIDRIARQVCMPGAPREGGERMIPEGWRLVPDFPTPGMCDALRVGSRRDVPSDQLCEVRYRAMLASAPTPPAQQDTPDMWLQQTSSERNPPHGWAVHFTPQDGDIPVFLKAKAPTPPAQDDEVLEVLRLALETMTCGDTGDDLEDSHRCGKCDEYVDRNAVVRQRIRALLAKRGEK